MTARVAAFALLAAALPTAAQQADPGLKLRMSELELGATHERLSGGRADWRSLYLEGARQLGERRTVYGGVRETERFGLRDSEGWLGYYHPLSPAWTAMVEAGASAEHRVLPRYFVSGQLLRQLAGGFGVSFGLRHGSYRNSGVDLLQLGAERYWGEFRAAYTLYAGRPQGGPSAVAHRFGVNYYYGERSSVGLSLTSGREAENTGTPAGVVTTAVRNLTIEGRHWLDPAWALGWSVLAHEQGSLYRREGFRIGLRHRF